MKYLAVQSADGIRLEEVNPYRVPSGLTNENNTEYWLFESFKRSFLTDDPRVVVGQQYEAGEYELVSQFRALNSNEWKLSNFNMDGYYTRQILRRRAEGEKDRQRRLINEVFQAEAGDEKQVVPDFLEYVKTERADFRRSMNRDNEKGSVTWDELSIPVRVAIEDILIAYDQMVERLAQQATN